MLELTIIVCILLVASFLADTKKTIKGVSRGLKMFINLLPALITMLALVSVLFFAIPNKNLVSLIGADIAPSIERFKETNIIVIDDYPTACDKRALNRHNFPEYNHIILTEMGYAKDKTKVSRELVIEITKKVEIISGSTDDRQRNS